MSEELFHQLELFVFLSVTGDKGNNNLKRQRIRQFTKPE